MAITVNGKNFEAVSEPLEVTSLHRPDEAWKHTDTNGHVHQWEWPSGKRRYDPREHATLPTLTRVLTGVEYDEEGEPFNVYHYECSTCREVVKPGYRADDCRQFIPGIRSYYIDGVPVSEEVFTAEVKAAYPDVKF